MSVVAIVATLGLALGQAEPASFADGVAAYRTGDYETAAAVFAELVGEAHSDADRGVLYYDLGNALWRAGERRRALAMYTAAVRCAPRDPDAWHNLELARAELGLEALDRGDLAATVERLALSASSDEARVLLFAASVLLAVALAVEALRGGRLARVSCWLSLLVVLAAATPLVWRAAIARDAPAMVVAETSVPLRSEPRTALDPIGNLMPGELVETIDALPDWTRVRLNDGTRGWLPKSSLEALPR